jgi:hypothetical protein
MQVDAAVEEYCPAEHVEQLDRPVPTAAFPAVQLMHGPPLPAELRCLPAVHSIHVDAAAAEYLPLLQVLQAPDVPAVAYFPAEQLIHEQSVACTQLMSIVR